MLQATDAWNFIQTSVFVRDDRTQRSEGMSAVAHKTRLGYRPYLTARNQFAAFCWVLRRLLPIIVSKNDRGLALMLSINRLFLSNTKRAAFGIAASTRVRACSIFPGSFIYIAAQSPSDI